MISALHHPRLAEEVRATVRLAAPIALAQIAQIGMGITDTVLLGGLGRDALAAGALGAMVFFILTTILQGILSAVAIVIAHARGSGDESRIAPALRTGYVVATAMALPLMLVMAYADPILRALQEPAGLAGMVGPYDRILLWATLPAMWLAVQRAYLTAMGRPQLILAVALAALVMNGFLNYGLIHGAFGLPRLGYLGSAFATAITIWVQMLATSLGIAAMSGLKRFHAWGAVSRRDAREIFHLGWPISVTIGVEILLFASGGLLAGILGTTALAAHQIALSVGSLTFMIPHALNQAANVRVGYHSGANAFRAARRAGFVAMAIGIGMSLISAAVMIAWPREIALLFLKVSTEGDSQVVELAARLLGFCAAFQVVDGLQAIAAGSLRGLKDTRIPMMLAAFSYWVVGFPTAWGLGLHYGHGAPGIWVGLALSLAVAAVLLVSRFWIMSGRAIAKGAIPLGPPLSTH
jgi:MATE family multidrug resistance protein